MYLSIFFILFIITGCLAQEPEKKDPGIQLDTAQDIAARTMNAGQDASASNRANIDNKNDAAKTDMPDAGVNLYAAVSSTEKNKKLGDGFSIEIPLSEERDRNSWFEMAKQTADTETLKARLARVKWDILPHSNVLVTVVEPGVDQPAFTYHAFGHAFDFPPSYFHPASTIKLSATVAALSTLAQHGMTGEAVVEFEDAAGKFTRKLHQIYVPALMHSSNEDYNRLIQVAGYEEINETWLSPRFGLPNMEINVFYNSKNEKFRISPVMRLSENGRKIRLPARIGRVRTRCASNCATLFELQEVLRRVALHRELPEVERFPITETDVDRILEQMRKTRKRLGNGPQKAFGEKVRIYNSVGRIPGVVLVENAYIVGEKSGRRVLAVVSIPFFPHIPKESEENAAWLAELARVCIAAVLAKPDRGPRLQHAGGIRIGLKIQAHAKNPGFLRISADAPGAERIRIWADHEMKGIFDGSDGHFEAIIQGIVPGAHVLIVEALDETRVLGVRPAIFSLPE